MKTNLLYHLGTFRVDKRVLAQTFSFFMTHTPQNLSGIVLLNNKDSTDWQQSIPADWEVYGDDDCACE